VKVPDSLEDIREFELPWWVFPEDEDEHAPSEPVQMHLEAENQGRMAPGAVSAGPADGGVSRHVKSLRRADGGDVEFRRFLDDVPHTQDSEKVAASALLQL
jgi:hypothetical protein